MSHLHEAVRIAHIHSVKEQNKQTKGYNRKLKGTHLNIGDRLLIANKGERGKKKLADKWNAKVYTVRDRNLRTHTYKLEDNNGDTKIVHRNLVLDVSFMPVEAAGVELCDVGSSMAGCFNDWEEADAEDRTSAWVMSGSDDTQSQGTSEPDDDVLAPEDPVHCFSDDHLPLADGESCTHSQLQPAGPVHDTTTQVHLEDTGCSTEAGHVVKTRVGRVTKKVN